MKLTIQAFLMLINQLQSTNPTCSMMVPFVVQMVLITIVITFPCLKVVCLETHPSPLVQNAHLKIKINGPLVVFLQLHENSDPPPPSPFLLICFLLIMVTQKIISKEEKNLDSRSCNFLDMNDVKFCI